MEEKPADVRKPFSRHLVDFGLGHWVSLLCGLALLGSVFIRWMGYIDHGVFVRLSGLDIARGFGEYPEGFLIPFVGLALALGSLAEYLMGRPDSMWGLSQPRVALVASLVSLVLAVEVGFRFDAAIKLRLGISFINNAGIGWYTAIVASVLVLAMSSVRLGSG